MHIVFITHEYPKKGYPHGGVGTFIQSLSRWLVSNGCKVSVIGINYLKVSENESDNGVQVFRLGRKSAKGLTWWLNSSLINKKLIEIHSKSKIDIIEGTELSFAFVKKIPNVKYLIRMNGGHHFFSESENRRINFWKGYQEKKSFSYADAVIGVSQYVVNHTSKYLSFQNKKKGVIFNPANLERFFQCSEQKIVSNRIFFAGTLCEKKGIRQLILAMPLIKEKIPNVHLVVAGRDWAFPKTGKSYLEFLKGFIKEEVRDSITFLGPVDNDKIPKLIEQAEICCYPSHMEAMPLAWIEVMAMGKAFIGSIAGPGPEIIESGFNGLLCDPLSPESIAEKVIFMLQNPNEAIEMGKRAREFALQKFSLEIIGKQNIDLYQSLL